MATVIGSGDVFSSHAACSDVNTIIVKAVPLSRSARTVYMAIKENALLPLEDPSGEFSLKQPFKMAAPVINARPRSSQNLKAYFQLCYYGVIVTPR